MKKQTKTAAKPRRKPSQARSSQKVEFILEATTQILLNDGFEKASTNRIAERAGVSIGTIYQYFPNKQALLKTLCERHINNMVEMISQRLANILNRPLDEATLDIVQAMLDAHALEPELHKVFVEQAPFILSADHLHQLEQRVITLVKLFLQQRVDEIHCKNLDMASFIIVQTIETLTHRAVLNSQEFYREPQFADEITRLIVNYLQTPMEQ